MLPKSAFGYIQSKQRYASQAELMAVAKGYRDRHLPIDTLVIDWFHDTEMGQMDMDPAKWPDPVGMNQQLHAMNFHTMISVWPRFVSEDRYYAMLEKHGWFQHLADGTPTNGLPYDRAGSDIDTTNPDAARWYWNTIKQNYLDKGFDCFWADETEPDLPPNGSYWKIGPGTASNFNVFPLFHTGAIYEGFRRDTHARALILARDAYIGAQHNGWRHLLVAGHQPNLRDNAAPPDSPLASTSSPPVHAVLEHRHRRVAVSAAQWLAGATAADRLLRAHALR